MNYPIYEKPYELWFALHDDLPYMKGGLRMVINITIYELPYLWNAWSVAYPADQ